MEKNTLSIDQGTSQKGQWLLALFLVMAIVQPVRAQLTSFAQSNQQASSGFIEPAHWLEFPLQLDSGTVWFANHIQAGARHQSGDWRLSVMYGKQAYARTNTAALVLSAQDKVNHEIDLPTVGQFALQADVWKMGTTTLALSRTWRLRDVLTLEAQPKLQLIHDYEQKHGQGILANVWESRRLKGTINSIGTRAYGYLRNERPDQGWAYGMDLRVNLQTQLGRLTLSIDNLINQQRFASVHFRTREYDVSLVGDQVQLKDSPSITGTYGVGERTEQLPKFWNLGYQPLWVDGLTVGAEGLNTDAAMIVRYSRPWREAMWWVKTVQGQNWTFGVDRSWATGWNIALAASANAHLSNPVMTALKIAKAW